MDPDPEAAYDAASQFVKATVITVAISTFTYYETQTFSAPPEKGKTLSVRVSPEHRKLPAARKKKQTLYLSFDDGPNKGTRNVMHIATAEQVPVTLFLVGQHVFGTAYQQETFDSLKACNMIELANHSYTHANGRYEKFYSSPDSVVSDFRKCRDSLKLNSGISAAHLEGTSGEHQPLILQILNPAVMPLIFYRIQNLSFWVGILNGITIVGHLFFSRIVKNYSDLLILRL